jgi:hypothetical protein
MFGIFPVRAPWGQLNNGFNIRSFPQADSHERCDNVNLAACEDIYVYKRSAMFYLIVVFTDRAKIVMKP